MKEILKSPIFYQGFQEVGGFFNARLKAIADYVAIKPGQRIIDIGCGPGYIIRHLPKDVDYIGFDIDEAYIAHANKTFGNRGRFFRRFFDADAAREFGPADVVMMNGVMHHIPDAELCATLANVKDVLKDDGVLLTLDGCYRDGQSWFAKWMLDHDRGLFIRDEPGYIRVLSSIFPLVNTSIREDYARVPYTWIVGISRK